MTGHQHVWAEVDRDENDNRIRTLDRCACGAERSGCYAKRLSDKPDGMGYRNWWGTPGEWHWSVREARP